MLRGNQFEQLQAELEFIALHCERLINTLKALESHDCRSIDIYNTVRDLLSWLRSPGFPFATSGCETAMQNAVEKHSDYVEWTKQPAISLFKAVCVFDPRLLPVLSKPLADFIAIPNIEQTANEWQIYVDIATNEELTRWCYCILTINATSAAYMLSALAISYIALPVASVDVKRSFLKYGSVLLPLRQSLSQYSLWAYCAVFYNQSLQSVTQWTVTFLN